MQDRLWPMKLMHRCISWIFSASQMTWLTVAAGSSERQTRSGAAVLWLLLLLLWFLLPALHLHQIWNKTSLSTFTMISSTLKLLRISDFRSGLKILLPLLHFYTLVVNWEFCSKWILSILPQGEIGWVPFHDGSNFEAIFKHEELCAQ